MSTITIPSYVVEYFLLGQTRKGEVERYTQDGGIVIDVWLQFAQDIHRPLRLLVAPTDGVRSVDVGYALHGGIVAYRKSPPAADGSFPAFPQKNEPLNISPLESFSAATVYFDELLRVVLPLTRWWDEKNLRALHSSAVNPKYDLPTKLRRAITIRLGREDENVLAALRKELSDTDDNGPGAIPEPSPKDYPNRRIIEAAPIAALIGVFCATIKDPNFIADLPKQAGSGSITPAGRTGAPAEDFLRWVHNKAEEIADAATNELKRYPAPAVFQPALDVVGLGPPPSPDNLPALIERVFANRDVQLAGRAGQGLAERDAPASPVRPTAERVAHGRAASTAPVVDAEEARGISPRASHGTGHKPLDLSDSCERGGYHLFVIGDELRLYPHQRRPQVCRFCSVDMERARRT
jgi:serine protease AprX